MSQGVLQHDHQDSVPSGVLNDGGSSVRSMAIEPVYPQLSLHLLYRLAHPCHHLVQRSGQMMQVHHNRLGSRIPEHGQPGRFPVFRAPNRDIPSGGSRSGNPSTNLAMAWNTETRIPLGRNGCQGNGNIRADLPSVGCIG